MVERRGPVGAEAGIFQSKLAFVVQDDVGECGIRGKHVCGIGENCIVKIGGGGASCSPECANLPNFAAREHVEEREIIHGETEWRQCFYFNFSFRWMIASTTSGT